LNWKRHDDAFREADMSNDKRRSYRLPVQEEFTKGTIQAGRKEWPATLVNESAGGFLIATSPKAPVAPGEMITVTLYSGSYLVEVVHTRVEDGQLHLGARRFDDELQPRPRVAVYRGWRKGAMPSPPQSIYSILLFGAYAAIAVLTVAFLLGDRSGRLAQTLLGNERGAHQTAVFSSLPTNFAGPIDWERLQSLQGINSLASEQVRRAIGLSNDQQRSLDAVFSDTGRRLKELFGQSQERPAEELSQESEKVIDEALQRVLCTLTDQQIDRWRHELIYAAASAPKPEQQAGAR
jgi:hypothetical protein